MRMRRSHRHRRHSQGGQGASLFQPTTIFTIGMLALTLVSAIPLGGAGFMAQQIIAALCIGMGILGGVLLRQQPGCLVWWSKKKPPRMTLEPEGCMRDHPLDVTRWAGWLAGALAGWCAFQLIRWPESWVRWMWRGDPVLYQEMAADIGNKMSVAVDRFISLHALLLWLGLGLLAWACSRQVRDGRRVALALHGIIVIGLFQTAYGIFVSGVSGRMKGTFANPDALGGLLALSLPVTLGFLLSRFKGYTLRGRVSWRRFFYRSGTEKGEWLMLWLLFCLSVQLLGLFFTGSRGAALAAALACGALLIWYVIERPRAIIAIALALTFLAGGTAIFSLRSVDRHVIERSVGETADWQQAGTARVELWRAAVRLCKTFPLGVGPGGTAAMLQMFQTGIYGRYRLDYAHNDYLQFLGDLGLPAFAALVLLLGLVLWRGARATRRGPAHAGGSVWLRRGILMAVAAGLFHALAEFNLSARPGVQTVFFILCGMLWGSVERKSSADDQATPPPRFQRLFHALRAGAIILGGVLAVGLALHAAQAWWLRCTAATALNLDPDTALWFKPPVVPPEQALDTMIRAVRLAPDSSFIRRSVAETRMVLHEKRVQKAAQNLLGFPQDAAATNLFLVAGNPEHEEALRLAGLALGVEEGEMLRANYEDVNAAVRLTPWDATARLMRGGILLRETALNIAAPEARERGWRDFDLVTRLYPIHGGVLLRACFELARSVLRQGMQTDRERLTNALLDWGGRALALDPSLSDAVIDAWWTARVPLARVLAVPDVPVAVLWPMYDLFDRQGNAEEARKCLAALKQRIAATKRPEAAALWSDTTRKKWELRQAQYRVRWVYESLKHLLRSGDWAGLEAFRPEREMAWQARLDIEMARLDLAGPTSSSLRRLRLHELSGTLGLDSKWTLERCLLDLDAGLAPASIQEAIAELLFLPGEPPTGLSRLDPWRSALDSAPFLTGLLAARESEAARQWDSAVAVLSEVLDSRQAPRRFLHRVLLWQARLLQREGREAESLDALRHAARACPHDPDLAAALAEAEAASIRADAPAARTSPANAPVLEIGFMGRRLVLRRAVIEEDPTLKGGLRLNLDWRFWGALPPDLQLVVGVRNQDGRSLFRKTVVLAQETGAAFSGGLPAIGSAWRLSAVIPPRAANGRYVQIIVKSNTASLASDEGLTQLDLAMDRLPGRGK